MDGLLRAFAAAFSGQAYIHRRAHTGDVIASYLYEDMVALGRSKKFVSRAADGLIVLNTANRIKGKPGRRGDGSLGTLAPTGAAAAAEGFSVRRGPLANLEIGIETKILATKMTAQLGRVITDLNGQPDLFHSFNRRAITVAIVGVNFAESYTGHEGVRRYDAKVPPVREAPDIVRRITEQVRPHFDECVMLRFAATNRPPFAFRWVDEVETRLEYGSALVRISDEYEDRF